MTHEYRLGRFRVCITRLHGFSQWSFHRERDGFVLWLGHFVVDVFTR